MAGVLVCVSVEFVDRVLKVDDPVGAISVHGANGIWGVISVGLFADGTSNYGGSWNGVSGSVTGLFYGDASQLVAQLIGVGTLIGFVFSFSYVANVVIDLVVGQRSDPAEELAGLDIPEMGALGLSRIRAETGRLLAARWRRIDSRCDLTSRKRDEYDKHCHYNSASRRSIRWQSGPLPRPWFPHWRGSISPRAWPISRQAMRRRRSPPSRSPSSRRRNIPMRMCFWESRTR